MYSSLQYVLMLIFFSFFKAYFFTRAGAKTGAGQKTTRSWSRSKMDRLRNTGSVTSVGPSLNPHNLSLKQKSRATVPLMS